MRTGFTTADETSIPTVEHTPHPDESAPLLFLLPGLLDDDLNFERVWDPLRKSLTVVGISYLDWTDLVKPGSHPADLISFIKRQIERALPVGPLRIAGYSIGGVLAYATALALQSEGRFDIRVAILDAPGKISPLRQPFVKRLRNVIQLLYNLRVREVLASCVAKCLTKPNTIPLLRRLSRFRHTRLPFNFHKYLHPKLTMQMELRLFRPWWSSITQPDTILTAPTFIFRSQSYDGVSVEDLGWGHYCSDCAVIRVAGDHISMLHRENNRFLLSTLLTLMTESNA